MSIIKRPYVQLVEYKTLRAEPSVRVLFDLGEVSPDVVKRLHEFRTDINKQGCCLILCGDKDYVKIMDAVGQDVSSEIQGLPIPEEESMEMSEV